MTRLLPYASLCALLFALTGCGREPPIPQRTIRVMGEDARIFAPGDTGEELELATQALQDTAQRVYPLIDVYSPASEIARANQIAFRSRFPISRETQRVLEYAQRLSVETGGAFDISDAPLRHIWARHFQSRPDEWLPAPLVHASKVGVGAHLYEVGDHSLLLLAPETQLDANDFAKAYVTDVSIVNLRRTGIGNVLIELGDIGRALGHADPTRSWTKVIPDPHRPDGHIGTLTLTDGSAYALVGWPHHYAAIADQRVSRIIDPRTGWPGESGDAVVVTGPVAAEAFALAQSYFLRGRENSEALLAGKPRYSVMFIEATEPRTLWTSPDFAPLFAPAPALKDAVRLIERPPPVDDTPDTEPEAPETEAQEPEDPLTEAPSDPL